jgi:hypothetical protein
VRSYPNVGGSYAPFTPRTVAPPPFAPPRRDDDHQPTQAAPSPIQPAPKAHAVETVAAPAIPPPAHPPPMIDFGTPTFVTPLTPPSDATECLGWWRICHIY